MRITCVVDDAVQRGSRYWGEHGVAFLVETSDGSLLFDTGQSGTVLLHNLDLFGVDPSAIDAIAISHGHYDHTGGLIQLLPTLGRTTSLVASPEIFRERYSVRDGEREDVGTSLTEQELAAHLSLRLHSDAQQLLPGVWTTGHIDERPEKEGCSSRHRMRNGDRIVQDRYLDDMALVAEHGDRLVLLCGCCHAGLLNTIAHAEALFERPVGAIFGGLHLTGASPKELRHICRSLARRPGLTKVFPNHCTGEAAYVAMTNDLGPSVVLPYPAGTTVEL